MSIPDATIERVLNLTLQGKLAWTVFGDTSFTTETGGVALALQKQTGGIWGDRFVLSIYDNKSRLLDRATGDGMTTLGALYETARRTSLDVDGKLAALDDALSKLEHS